MKRWKRMKRLAMLALCCCLLCSALPVQAAQSSLEKKVTQIVNKKVKDGDSRRTKLKKLFVYVETLNYKRKIGFKATSGWEKKYALEMLNKKQGSCYHYAAAYAFLAKKAAGCPVRVCIGRTNGFDGKTWQAHAWAEVKIKGKWYICDPNLDKFGADSSGKYFLKRTTAAKMKSTYKTTKRVTVKF